MQKNIRLEKPANATELPAGWYKESGLPIWYTNIFGNKFQITNAHETAPGMWFLNCNNSGWRQIELLPAAEKYDIGDPALFKAALKQIREYFLLCISIADHKIEQIHE